MHRQTGTIEGAIKRAPYVGNGVAMFTLVHRTDRGTTYIDCKTFDLVDEVRDLREGQEVLLSYRLRNEKDSRLGADGREIWKTVLVVDNVQLVGQSSPPSGRPTPVYGSSSPAAKPDLSKPVIAAEDIPF